FGSGPRGFGFAPDEGDLSNSGFGVRWASISENAINRPRRRRWRQMRQDSFRRGGGSLGPMTIGAAGDQTDAGGGIRPTVPFKTSASRSNCSAMRNRAFRTLGSAR